jgi:hypothetical protein
VSELSLDDDQPHALAGHLHRVCAPQLVRREASANAGSGGCAPELGACTAGAPRASAGASIEDAEQRTDRQRDACDEPGLELLPSPVVHPDLAASPCFAATHEH